MCFDPRQELESEVGIIWHYARNSECRRTTVLGSSPVSIKVSGTLNMISRYIYIWCPHEFPSVWKCESCVPVSRRVISLHISDQVTWHGHYLATWQGGHWCSFEHKMTVLYCFNHLCLQTFASSIIDNSRGRGAYPAPDVSAATAIQNPTVGQQFLGILVKFLRSFMAGNLRFCAKISFKMLFRVPPCKGYQSNKF